MTTDDPAAPSEHRLAWDLIPWVVNGSASATQQQAVDAHQRGCADCREELEFQRLLHAGMNCTGAPVALPEIERALQAFWAQPAAANDAPPAPRRRPGRRALLAVIALQAVGLAAALGALGTRRGEPARIPAEYTTLSEPGQPAAAAVIRLVPAPGLQIGELRALLARSDLQIVQASADAAHLGLALVPGARFGRAEAIGRLRAEPGVLLAEPIAAAP